jgi:hypothetical protein
VTHAVHHVNHILSIYCDFKVAGCLCTDRADLRALNNSLEAVLSSLYPQPLAKAPSRPSGPSDTRKYQAAQRQTMANIPRMQRNIWYALSSRLLLFTSEPWTVTGDVVYLSVLGRSMIVLNSQKAAADLLGRRASNYSDRPRFIVASEILTGGMEVSFLQYGML